MTDICDTLAILFFSRTCSTSLVRVIFTAFSQTDSVVKKLNIWCIERSIWPFYHSEFFQGVQFWAADSLFQKLLKSLTLAVWRNAESFLFAREYSIKNDLIEYQMSCQAKDDAHISLEWVKKVKVQVTTPCICNYCYLANNWLNTPSSIRLLNRKSCVVERLMSWILPKLWIF